MARVLVLGAVGLDRHDARLAAAGSTCFRGSDDPVIARLARRCARMALGAISPDFWIDTSARSADEVIQLGGTWT